MTLRIFRIEFSKSLPQKPLDNHLLRLFSDHLRLFTRSLLNTLATFAYKFLSVEGIQKQKWLTHLKR
jgi:hypothetical protein